MAGLARGKAKFGPPTVVLDGNRERYIEVSKQVRRMPVALVLLVDQLFMQDALVAYANSPLRFQVTQSHWKRFRGTLSATGGIFPGGATPPGGSGDNDLGRRTGSSTSRRACSAGGFQPGRGTPPGGNRDPRRGSPGHAGRLVHAVVPRPAASPGSAASARPIPPPCPRLSSRPVLSS